MPGLVNPNHGTGSGLTPSVSAEHARLLKDVVRSNYRLDADAPVVVQQLTCREPGCPPVETVVAVLGPPRRTWKFPKPVSDVLPSELHAAIIEHPEGMTHASHE